MRVEKLVGPPKLKATTLVGPGLCTKENLGKMLEHINSALYDISSVEASAQVRREDVFMKILNSAR